MPHQLEMPRNHSFQSASHTATHPLPPITRFVRPVLKLTAIDKSLQISGLPQLPKEDLLT
jgi:hypothetical protein